MKAVCPICPHHCSLEEGAAGLCGARHNQDGQVVSDTYGQLTSLALDPIEKKPLRRFFPGSFILSVGSAGCNMHCPFCQNHEISMPGPGLHMEYLSPVALAELAQRLAARPAGNLGAAFTYNEPVVSYEYVLAAARELHSRGLRTVLVTNGMIAPEPLARLLPFVDAMNIDLKGFSAAYYHWLGGDLEAVQAAIAQAAAACHVEVTTLILPGKNDGTVEMAAEARWLASLSPELPLHISRFFPRYQLLELQATPVETIRQLCSTAGKYLRWVYAGNC